MRRRGHGSLAALAVATWLALALVDDGWADVAAESPSDHQGIELPDGVTPLNPGPTADPQRRWWTMTGIALGTLASEDLALIGGGMLAARGQLHLAEAILAGFVGILGGDLLLYAAGRFLAGSLLRRAPMRWIIAPRDLARGREWFTHHKGLAAILGSRFVPGLRLPTYVAAGALHAPFGKVFGLLALAAAVWVPLVVTVSMQLGQRLQPLLLRYERWAPLLVLSALLGGWIAMTLAVPALSWEGRRRLWGRWLRWRHWEFWPMWRFYPPVVVHVLWLGIKHRSLTLFTLANPAMPAGGVLGESKNDIYQGLAAGAGEALLAYTLVMPGPVEQRVGAVRDWMKARDQAFPIVLKPDAGQRGTGVLIARDLAQMVDYFEAITVPVIAQEFAPGREFGVFYIRPPYQDRGRIFSITETRPTTVTGDGVRTLGQLILMDERAVCMAARFEQAHAERLYDVVPAGEVVALVDIGTHRLGAEFKDGAWVWTPELEAAIDRISRAYPGFNFGRYDLRTPDLAAFRSGNGFKIVELNGVTAEATHIYDRRHSVFDAWRILREQWRQAFAIGDGWRARGLRPVGLPALLRLLLAYQAAE